MIAELLSLFTAFCYESSAIFLRKGLKTSNTMSAVLVSTPIQFVILWITFIFLSQHSSPFDVKAVLFFVLAGVSATGIGRMLNYIGINRLGVSIIQPLIGSAPLFSIITAAVFLTEQFALFVYLGTALIILGVAILSQRSKDQLKINGLKRMYIIIPLLAALFYGSSSTFRKIGLNILNLPLFGATIGVSASWIFLLLFLIFSGRIKTISLDKPSLRFFSCSGLFVSIGMISMFYAYSEGKVGIVAPLIATNPLFALLFSYVFLKNTEKISYKIVIGAGITLLGVILISMFRS